MGENEKGLKRDQAPTAQEFYDSQIRPLVTQLVEKCEAAGLPVVIGIQSDHASVNSAGMVPPWADHGLKIAGLLLRSEEVRVTLLPIYKKEMEDLAQDLGGFGSILKGAAN